MYPESYEITENFTDNWETSTSIETLVKKEKKKKQYIDFIGWNY